MMMFGSRGVIFDSVPEDQTILERLYREDTGSQYGPKYIVTGERDRKMYYFYEVVDDGLKLLGRHKNAAYLLTKFYK